jgi:hypothetical protein
MKHIVLVSLVATLTSSSLIPERHVLASETITIDLTQWAAPDITSVGDDPFGQIVQYGYALFTDTANEMLMDSARRNTNWGHSNLFVRKYRS